MFAYMVGILENVTPDTIILETQGIGYAIHIPYNFFLKHPPLKSTLKVHTTLVSREFSQTLFGFSTEKEKKLFETFITISGVGPKLALSLIGHIPLCELEKAIENNDSTMLCKVPGVGKKTASRLLVELKDKLVIQRDFAISKEENPFVQDAILALINLGYNQSSAQKALNKISDKTSLDLPELITRALKEI